MLDFKGKVFIVTGSGEGIGKAYALLLARRGARVVVNSRSAAAVQEIQAVGGTPPAVMADAATLLMACSCSSNARSQNLIVWMAWKTRANCWLS
jgi:NAD(P)-dependent dehydrogenase (short-subunit alcohol dehydrogenase family)